ncbi:hypothetical protein L218DRAFT_950702 [Marasmius fiardii PR-910]|nr:hypothetical protein L218DRAFT_950702 [Marasmius fiardii PR-910]
MPALPPYLTASRSGPDHQQIEGCWVQHVRRNTKSAEVDGVKQLSAQEEKRWKGIEALKRSEWILEPLSSAELVGAISTRERIVSLLSLQQVQRPICSNTPT